MFTKTRHLCFVFFSLAACTLFDFTPKNVSLKTHFVNKLLHKYQTFQIIFHVDNFSQRYVNNFDEIQPLPIVIYNHYTAPNTSFKRPFLQKCLHFVSLRNPNLFSTYLQHKRTVFERDIVIFLVDYTKVTTFSKKYWLMPRLERAGSILVIDLTQESSFDVYKLCFFCGQITGQILLVKTINATDLDLPAKILFSRQFNNFYGHELRVAYSTYYPYVFCSKKVESNCEEFSGIELEMLKMLAHKMNFTFTLFETRNDMEVLFEGLMSHKYDFAIGGLSMTPQRFDVVQYSVPLFIETIVAMYTYNSSYTFAAISLFLPFPATVWIGIVVVVLGMAFIVYLMSKVYDDVDNVLALKILKVLW